MNWDHAVSWGRRVWVSVSDIGRVEHTGSGGWPTGIEKTQKTSVLLFGLGGSSTKLLHVWESGAPPPLPPIFIFIADYVFSNYRRSTVDGVIFYARTVQLYERVIIRLANP